MENFLKGRDLLEILVKILTKPCQDLCKIMISRIMEESGLKMGQDLSQIYVCGPYKILTWLSHNMLKILT